MSEKCLMTSKNLKGTHDIDPSKLSSAQAEILGLVHHCIPRSLSSTAMSLTCRTSTWQRHKSTPFIWKTNWERPLYLFICFRAFLDVQWEVVFFPIRWVGIYKLDKAMKHKTNDLMQHEYKAHTMPSSSVSHLPEETTWANIWLLQYASRGRNGYDTDKEKLWTRDIVLHFISKYYANVSKRSLRSWSNNTSAAQEESTTWATRLTNTIHTGYSWSSRGIHVRLGWLTRCLVYIHNLSLCYGCFPSLDDDRPCTHPTSSISPFRAPLPPLVRGSLRK